MSRPRPIELSELSKYFQMPEKAVAKELGICLTSLKKICRQNGITRWPYRKIKSLDKKLRKLEHDMSEANDTGHQWAAIPASDAISIVETWCDVTTSSSTSPTPSDAASIASTPGASPRVVAVPGEQNVHEILGFPDVSDRQWECELESVIDVTSSDVKMEPLQCDLASEQAGFARQSTFASTLMPTSCESGQTKVKPEMNESDVSDDALIAMLAGCANPSPSTVVILAEADNLYRAADIPLRSSDERTSENDFLPGEATDEFSSAGCNLGDDFNTNFDGFDGAGLSVEGTGYFP